MKGRLLQLGTGRGAVVRSAVLEGRGVSPLRAGEWALGHGKLSSSVQPLSAAPGLQSRWGGWSADLQRLMENIHHSRHRQRPQPVCPCPQWREPSSCAVSRSQSCHRTGRGRTPPFFPAWRPGSQTPSFHGSYILRCFLWFLIQEVPGLCHLMLTIRGSSASAVTATPCEGLLSTLSTAFLFTNFVCS